MTGDVSDKSKGNLPIFVFRTSSLFSFDKEMGSFGPVIFKLVDIVKLYKQRLELVRKDSAESDLYSTRLKKG